MTWIERPLPEVLEFREGPGILAADFRDEGVPLIRLAGLKGNSLLTGCNYLDHAKVEAKWDHFRVREGDALLSTSASLGEVAIVDAEAVGAIPYTGIILFRPSTGDVDASFIPLMLTDPRFKEQVHAMGEGSVMKHFGPMHLRLMTVRYPEIRTQRAIAEVLGALDDKIAANRRVVANVLALGEATLHTHNLIPRPLSDIATVTMGTSPRGELLREGGPGLPFFQGVRDFGAIYPTERIFTENPVKTTPGGSILFAVRAPVGKTNLAVGTTAIGRGLAGISAPAQPATLYFAMRAFESVWDEFQGTGTVFASVNGNDVKSTKIPMPGKDQGSTLEERLAPLLARAVAAETENTKLGSTRDELLPLLMSGKITVKDAEKHVEGQV